MGLKSYIWPYADDEDKSPHRSILGQLRAIERLCLYLLGAVAVSITLYSASLWRADSFHVFALLSAAMLAALTVGGVLGFIFGIPRFLRQAEAGAMASSIEKGQGEAATVADRSYRSYVGNTNLEEVSDWLTKIIIGVGLVEAGKLVALAQDVAAKFAGEMRDVEGAGGLFTAVVVTAFSGGFLLFYLETRTRITLLLTDADAAAGLFSEGDTRPVIQSPLFNERRGADCPQKEKQPQNVEADRKFLPIPFQKLRTAADYAAWGAAQARANNLQAAIRALQEAISLNPKERRYLEMLADIQLRYNNPLAAINALSEARAKSPSEDTSLLRRELLTALYLPRPDGFIRALDIARKLLSGDTSVARDPMVHLWQASAFGQKYSWLMRNNGSTDQLAEARSGALKAVREVVQRAPEPNASARILMRDLFDPVRAARTGDDDLAVFNKDSAFRSVIIDGQIGDGD